MDLDKALAYEIAPSADGKLVLTLHAQEVVAKSVAAPAAKTPAPVAKAQAPAAQPVATKTVSAPKVLAVAKASDEKPAAVTAKAEPKQQPVKTVVAAKPAAASAPVAVPAKVEVAKTSKPEEKKPEEKKWAMNGKRDPFFSPVVQQNGSGCSTGKKCLEIDAINVRGVVKSDTGFIAVVTNNLNKAYFLRENDPVFNGYVVKITGDSVAFQETLQDKLGKTFTREVVKKIITPGGLSRTADSGDGAAEIKLEKDTRARARGWGEAKCESNNCPCSYRCCWWRAGWLPAAQTPASSIEST